jgi:hypothetical protein
VNPQAIDFEIMDVRGCQHALRAVHITGDGWLLETSIDGRLFTHKCKDWPAAERTIQCLRARPAPHSAAPDAAGQTRVSCSSPALVVA